MHLDGGSIVLTNKGCPPNRKARMSLGGKAWSKGGGGGGQCREGIFLIYRAIHRRHPTPATLALLSRCSAIILDLTLPPQEFITSNTSRLSRTPKVSASLFPLPLLPFLERVSMSKKGTGDEESVVGRCRRERPSEALPESATHAPESAASAAGSMTRRTGRPATR